MKAFSLAPRATSEAHDRRFTAGLLGQARRTVFSLLDGLRSLFNRAYFPDLLLSESGRQ